MRYGIISCVLLVLSCLSGCGEAVKETHDTVVDEVTGKRAIDQGEAMKQELDRLNQQAEQRNQQTDGQ